MRLKVFKNHKNDGFTLIELVVSLAIIAIIALIVNNYLTSGSKIYRQEQNTVNLTRELQIVSEHLYEEIQECESVLKIDPGDKTIRFILRKNQTDAVILIFHKEDHWLKERKVTVTGSTRAECDTNIEDNAKGSYETNDTGTLCTVVNSLTIVPVAGDSTFYSFDLTVKNGDKQISCSKQMQLRNSK